MTRFEQYISSLQRFGIQPGLERIEALLSRLGQPHESYPHILVGGTNGKGSTCEFLARLLAESGETVGLYTSPHLYHWHERIRVLSQQTIAANGQVFADAISDANLDALFDDARPHLDAVAQELGQPTEFETITALALWHFARSGVGAAVLEVGLGGRWDATNVTNPLVSAITHVALDHCDRLGDTLEAIARDKVEIARTGHVLVTAETKPNVLQVFADYCAEHSTKLWPIFAPDWASADAVFHDCLHFIESAPSGSDDVFQRANQQTALAAFYAFQTARGLKVGTAPKDLPLRVPGRMEIVRENPRVILDVCNNPDGAAHLASALPALLPSGGKLILVLGILADKDFTAMTQILAPLAQVLIATQSQSPRAAAASSIAAAAQGLCEHIETIAIIPDAVRRALHLATPKDAILIAGSFTTVGEIERSHFSTFDKF